MRHMRETPNMSYYTCCGSPANGSQGGGCDHEDGHVVSARRWRQLSHGAVGPWRPAWRPKGASPR